MSDAVRQMWQLAGSIFGVGFVIVLGFSQLADYFVDKKPRHLFAAAAWFMLVSVLVFQAAGYVKPPLLDPAFIAAGMAVSWAIAVLLGAGWAILRQVEKWREAAARRRLGINDETEGKAV